MFKLTGVIDASDGAELHSIVSHVPEAPVLSGPQVHHAASVAWLLVHQPVAVHHVAGLAVGHAVTILDVVAVVLHLVLLASEVLHLVEPYSVGAFVLLRNKTTYKWLVALIGTCGCGVLCVS